jgi:hypothetical protein
MTSPLSLESLAKGKSEGAAAQIEILMKVGKTITRRHFFPSETNDLNEL